LRFIIAMAAVLMLGAAVRAQTFAENFDEPDGFFGGGTNNTPSYPPGDWQVVNNSDPAGQNSWYNGPGSFEPSTFAAQSGAGYAAVDAASGEGNATLSNWLILPQMTFTAGENVSFYTRTVDDPQYADRLQLNFSLSGASYDVGTTSTSVGVFTTNLLDINPDYALTGPGSFPDTWTQFTVQIPSSGSGRLAFRYFVEDGGPLGDNSDLVGVDTISITPSTPEPAAVGLLVMGVVWGVGRRHPRRRLRSALAWEPASRDRAYSRRPGFLLRRDAKTLAR
jgi:hypothetical protein